MSDTPLSLPGNFSVRKSKSIREADCDALAKDPLIKAIASLKPGSHLVCVAQGPNWRDEPSWRWSTAAVEKLKRDVKKALGSGKFEYRIARFDESKRTVEVYVFPWKEAPTGGFKFRQWLKTQEEE